MRHQWIHRAAVLIMAIGLMVINGSVPASASGQRVYLAANGANPRSAAVAPRDAAISVDSSLFLGNMTWTQWDTRAIGTGTATLNLCEPNCAGGTSVSVPVSVTLSEPRLACGREFFTAMVLTIIGRIPVGLGRSSEVPVTPFC